MTNLSNVFILLHLKCTVHLFGVGILGQTYLIFKLEIFLRKHSTEIVFIKHVLLSRLRLFKKNQAKSKALNLFQNVKQAENSKWSLWNYCTI